MCAKTIKKMKVRSNSFRKLNEPFDNQSSKKYLFYVHIDDVVEGIPMSTNPREQKLTSSVSKMIEQSLQSNDERFHLKNRGIVLSAESVEYDNQKEEVTIIFSDEETHGNIDGGHTYKIILDNQDKNFDQYVQFEVMTNVEDILEQLAESRNTSVQVDAKSMAELTKKFDPIKKAIEDSLFYNRISFKQNQLVTDKMTGKNARMIDAREIVAIVLMFNLDKYHGATHPIQAYSSKAKMLEYYLTNPEYYLKYINVVPDFFNLYDTIETEFAEAYNAAGGRYGRKKYSGYQDGKKVGLSKFNQRTLIYKIPDGLMYPVIGAFRSLLEYDNISDTYKWKDGCNPFEIWEKHKGEITSKVMNFASSIGDNPNSVGKDSNVWDIAYMTVLLKVS